MDCVFLRPLCREWLVGGRVEFESNELKIPGEVSEWLKEHAWKVCIGEILSRVRIPPSPQIVYQPFLESLLNIVLTGFLLDRGAWTLLRFTPFCVVFQ